MDDIYIYYADIPVGEMVTPCEGGYTLYLDTECLYDRERRLKKYLHAVSHITGNDWSEGDVQGIEQKRHR